MSWLYDDDDDDDDDDSDDSDDDDDENGVIPIKFFDDSWLCLRFHTITQAI